MRKITCLFAVTLCCELFSSAFQLPHLPKNPEFFSAMTMIYQGSMEAPMPAPKGRVRELKWERFQTRQEKIDKGLQLRWVVAVTYDDQGHEIERTDEDAYYGGKTKSSQDWRDGRLQSVETRVLMSRGKAMSADSARWSRFIYDSSGRVIEFRRGSGTALENHFLNYKYDSEGRPASWDYRQGATDDLFSRTEVKYVGSTVEKTAYDKDGRKTDMQVQGLDDAGRVNDLKVFDLNHGQLKLWYHTTFKYDDRGRVIEQKTDDYKFGSGDDYAPLPGKLEVHFDDVKRLAERNFYDIAGKRLIRTLCQLDNDGNVISLRVFDAADKEEAQADFVPNSKAGKMESQRGSVVWEVAYDDRGNWTERQRWFTPAAGGPRMLVETVRQTITYR